MILVQLGTNNPGRSDDEKSQWTDGLRAVLKELRSKGVRDPGPVALAIADYRRRFFNDQSRVLDL